MCYLFYKTFPKMANLSETQRIEILILIDRRTDLFMAIQTFNSLILST
jgi:hypothetical protein